RDSGPGHRAGPGVSGTGAGEAPQARGRGGRAQGDAGEPVRRAAGVVAFVQGEARRGQPRRPAAPDDLGAALPTQGDVVPGRTGPTRTLRCPAHPHSSDASGGRVRQRSATSARVLQASSARVENGRLAFGSSAPRPGSSVTTNGATRPGNRAGSASRSVTRPSHTTGSSTANQVMTASTPRSRNVASVS